MKVLLIDDDLTTQKVMNLLLEKSGFTPVITGTGAEGLAIATGPDAPPLVILDWVLPDMDGPTICKKLRAANPPLRPYILFLSMKREKSDAAEALDLGADDYVTKPFNVVEFQARLRAARRLLDYQRELQSRIDASEVLGRRSELLCEISQNPEPPRPPESLPAPSPAAADPLHFSDQEIRFILSATLLEMRLALEATQLRSGGSPASVKRGDNCAWDALLLVNRRVWLDALVAVEPAGLDALFEKALGRKPDEPGEARYFLAEMARAVAQGLQRAITIRGDTARQPMMSRTVKLGSFNPLPPLADDTKAYDLVVDGIEVRLLLVAQPCPLQELAPTAVRELDLLAEAFPPKSISMVAMFPEGEVFSPRFIEKLVHHVETSQIEAPVKIYRPTALTHYFCRQG